MTTRESVEAATRLIDETLGGDMRNHAYIAAHRLSAAGLLAGEVDEEAVERGARALADLDPDEDWPTNEELGGSLIGTRDDEYRDGKREDARRVLLAARVAPSREAEEEVIQVGTDSLAREIHEAWEFQYDQCDHGTYRGGHLNGEPYAMCELTAARIVRRRAASRTRPAEPDDPSIPQPLVPEWGSEHCAQLADRSARALDLAKSSTGELATWIELILTGQDHGMTPKGTRPAESEERA